jgi:hypothetical protein
MPLPSTGISHLFRWCAAPTSPLELFTILRDIPDADLARTALHVGGAAGRLAWLEIARRKEYFNFDIEIAEASGKLSVIATAAAKPIHDFPQYASS